ncbi:complement decay-accelerating factor isoform X2 [Antennarius striatus]|uniref:complement decay-accelerating factor isoform X2 n=1 Tax=Antennarius striatus TaxID=241820 RepID=UPI0035B40D46
MNVMSELLLRLPDWRSSAPSLRVIVSQRGTFAALLRSSMDGLLDTCGRRRVGPLLFTYLFIMKIAADCPKPQPSGNFVLTNEALLMNHFPEGSRVSLECANGYIPESGDGITFCTGGIWSTPNLECKKKDCGLPKSQPNMSFNISTGTLFGNVIKVVCDKGYELSGSSYKQCYASGWAGKAKCEIVTCDTLDPIANGMNSWEMEDRPKYGEIIHYTCNEGYSLFGKNNIMCSETGEYDSQPPECKASPKSIATPTGHRHKTVTTSAAPTGSSSAPTGVREFLTTEDKATAIITSTTAFQVFPTGVVTANQLPPSNPVFCILFSHTNHLHVLFHHIHKPPLWSSSRPPAWQEFKT